MGFRMGFDPAVVKAIPLTDAGAARVDPTGEFIVTVLTVLIVGFLSLAIEVQKSVLSSISGPQV